MVATRASVLGALLLAALGRGAPQYPGYDPESPSPVLQLTTYPNNYAFANQGFDGRGAFYLDSLTVQGMPVWKHVAMDFFLHLNPKSHYIFTRAARADLAAAATADGTLYCPSAVDKRWPHQMTCQWMYRDTGVTSGWTSSFNIKVTSLTQVPDKQVLLGLPASFWDAQGFNGNGTFHLQTSTFSPQAQGWPVWKHESLDFYLYVTRLGGRYKFAKGSLSSLQGSDDGIITCPSSMLGKWPFEMEAWEYWDGSSWITQSSVRVAQREDATTTASSNTTTSSTGEWTLPTTTAPWAPTTTVGQSGVALGDGAPRKALALAALCWQAQILAAHG